MSHDRPQGTPDSPQAEDDEYAWLEEGAVSEEGGTARMPADLEAVLEAAEEEEDDEGRYDGPPLPPLLIVAVVGLLVGFATVGLVWVSERGCEWARDSSNCGPVGFPLLLLIVVVSVVLGGMGLSRLAMPHPWVVAFLGVGFMLILVLAFLTDNLSSRWTLAVVPALTAITFLVAHLVARLLERADA
jgi:hypothetical protein